MSLSFYGKRPGPGMRLGKQSLRFTMHDTGMVGDVLEAYERLILDAMRGDLVSRLTTNPKASRQSTIRSTGICEAPLSLKAGSSQESWR
jgi:glucose-6-phosphate 1-dehydrogenase